MRIPSVNNVYSSVVNKQQVPSYKGLWGRTSVIFRENPVLCITERTEEKYYYPFYGEKEEDIKKIIASKKSATITNNGRVPQYYIFDCKRARSLPFTKQQYEAYMRLRKGNKKNYIINEMDVMVRDKYLNADNWQTQIPAYNPDL